MTISFAPGYVGAEAWTRQLETIRAAVTHLGLKVVAPELDIGVTYLSDALNERENKGWRGRWTHVLKAMLAARRDDASAELLRAIAEADVAATPFALVDAEPLTVEEENLELRRELLKFGEAGKQSVERVTKKKGRR